MYFSLSTVGQAILAISLATQAVANPVSTDSHPGMKTRSELMAEGASLKARAFAPRPGQERQTHEDVQRGAFQCVAGRPCKRGVPLQARAFTPRPGQERKAQEDVQRGAFQCVAGRPCKRGVDAEDSARPQAIAKRHSA